jgi:ATP-dependent Clp protease protease subunit
MILMPEPAGDDVASQLLRRRIVMVTGRLDQAAAEEAVARLVLLDRQSRDPITVHLTVPDADLDPALTLVATIDMIEAPLHAVAAGSVEGAAVAVYAAATERRAHPHTTFLLREPRADLHGDADALETAAEQHRRQLATLHERIATATGKPAADVARDMEHGRLLTADDAVAYGLVHSLTAPA